MNDSTTPNKVYESEIDRWVIALLLLSPLTSAAIGVYFFIDGKADGAAILLAAAAVTLLVSIAFTLPCRYTLTEDLISIRCGIFVFYRVPYLDIESVERSATWRSGPALSLKRVEIKTKEEKRDRVAKRPGSLHQRPAIPNQSFLARNNSEVLSFATGRHCGAISVGGVTISMSR